MLDIHDLNGWIRNVKKSRKSKQGDALNAALMSIITHDCENDVLSIMQRCFVEARWIVRVKIFDGLIVEKGKGPEIKELQ